MTDLLRRIVERKRIEVAGRLGGGPVEAEPTRRSLRAALQRPGARFVMEVKRRSPSGHRSVVAVADAAAAYASVADAISVLTDEADFGGSLDDLRLVRKLFDGPILAKDFIVDARQVGEARSAGADAVLAMLSVLADAEAARVMAEARRLDMEVIVEVHDEAELARAVRLGAKIIGINNRDFRTLTTDLAVTERLAPLVPANVTLIAESGIGSRADVERLAPLVDAFLVGSSLMAAENINEAARALVHGRVKLCGLTRDDDVAAAARSGATHAGFIMVPGTPRAVEPSRLRDLAEQARSIGLKPVGVYRDSDPRDVARQADLSRLDAVQLHGREAPAAFRQRLPPNVELWALCGVGTDVAASRPGADRSLFDTVRSGRSGGTGSAFDWSLITGRDDLSTGFLAGGIGPRNARRAATVGAYGLDVGSAVESGPGIKDEAMVHSLFAALRPDCRGAE